MTVTLIAAVARGRVIGRAGGIPWRLPADLRRFKRITMGHWLILGRRTFDSIGRPLPGRTTVVVTRREAWRTEGVLVARSIPEALAMARRRGEREVFVAGGAQIYEATLPMADRIHLTTIDLSVEGDAFFPEIDGRIWRVVEEEAHPAEGEAPAHRFLTFERSTALLDSPGAPR